MKIEEHKRRAMVYREAVDVLPTQDFMCYALEAVDSSASDPRFLRNKTGWAHRELERHLGDLDRFTDEAPDPWCKETDSLILRGDILTLAAEYHEACVAAGRTL